MNIIEQMYKEYGVRPINIAEHGSTYITNAIKIDDEFYPPFTTEKQIKLLEILITDVMGWEEFTEIMYLYTYADSDSFENNFKNAIVQLIIDNKNNYIDNSKVKEILEK